MCPVLIQAGTRDITVSPFAIARFARLASQATVKPYDIDHFGAFHGEHCARIAHEQAEWITCLN